jgi:SAM-dependent methyltransferase
MAPRTIRSNERFELWSPPCPICGGEDFRPLAANDRYGMGLSTVGCLSCGLVQTWPRPTPEAMAGFYRSGYRNYYQSVIAPDDGYAERYGKMQRLGYTAGQIQERIGLRSGMRILDVGCAEGTLFTILRERCEGLQLVGIEPSPEFASYARHSSGCRTYDTVEQAIARGEEKFQLVVVNHVLEHADDPVGFLGLVKSVLAPGGAVYVDVPDVERYAGPASLHVAHLFHFSGNSLAAAARRAGLEVRLISPHDPPHHPPSILAVLQEDLVDGDRVAGESPLPTPGWSNVRAAGRMMPLYRLRRRLDESRLLRALVRRLRRRGEGDAPAD